MEKTYDVAAYGTAFGIFRVPVDPDSPVLTIYDEDAAKDLAIALNWAAEDRRQHQEDRPKSD